MSMLFKRIKDWATSITAFRTGDYIAVDGPSGTAKMDKDDLLQVTADNAKSKMSYITDADENAAKINGDKETAVSGYIVTNALNVGDTIDLTDVTSSSSVSHVIVDALMGDQYCYDGKSGTAFQAIIAVDQNSKIIDKKSYANGNSVVYTAPIYTRKILFQGYNTDTPNFGVWKRKSVTDAIAEVVADYDSKVDKINSQIQEWRELVTTAGRYLTTNVAEGTVVNFVCTESSGNPSACVVVSPVKKGQLVRVLGNGGNALRLWAFLDADQKLISKSSSNLNWTTPHIIEAPTDGYFVGNSWTNVTYKFEILDYKEFRNSDDFPQARFNVGHDFISSVGDFFDEFSFTAEGRPLIFGQVQGKYDDLITDYPGQVSKVNAYTAYGVEKPAYNTEETYLYHIDFKNSLLTGNNSKRKKVFLVGGAHGNEYAGQLALAFFMRQICTSADPMYVKFRQCCDIYVIPVLSEYGCKNRSYTNGNGVNINRNYPTYQWLKQGDGTVQFSGNTPASEAETQLVMAIVSSITPDIIVDCHSYDNLEWQFYMAANKQSLVKPSYDWAMDCGIAFVKALPFYFGTSHRIFVDHADADALPANYSGFRIGSLNAWGGQQINAVGKATVTLEVSSCINYEGGQPHVITSGEWSTRQYTSDVWKIAEYTYRRCLAGLLETCME